MNKEDLDYFIVVLSILCVRSSRFYLRKGSKIYSAGPASWCEQKVWSYNSDYEN